MQQDSRVFPYDSKNVIVSSFIYYLYYVHLKPYLPFLLLGGISMVNAVKAGSLKPSQKAN
jgi:hypothetical protein